MLVVKEHPLDDGLVNWRRHVERLAAQAGIADRVIYLEMGDIVRLIGTTLGVVTVNSTTGTLALGAGVPVITLGTAIYDIAGLTHQGTLDSFWVSPAAPDPVLFDAFRRVLTSRCLLVGSFFSEAGIQILVRNAIDRLEASAPGHAMTVARPAPAAEPAPRLRRAAIPT
jgi:capsular polysaccharide export protein